MTSEMTDVLQPASTASTSPSPQPERRGQAKREEPSEPADGLGAKRYPPSKRAWASVTENKGNKPATPASRPVPAWLMPSTEALKRKAAVPDSKKDEPAG